MVQVQVPAPEVEKDPERGQEKAQATVPAKVPVKEAEKVQVKVQERGQEKGPVTVVTAAKEAIAKNVQKPPKQRTLP